MNRVDVHPEDLLDAAHRGQLDAAGQERLAQHLAHCAACAAEVALIDDFEGELSVGPEDDALLDRLVAGAVGEAPPVRRSVPPRSSTSRRLLFVVAASLAIGAFGGAALAMVAVWPRLVDDEAPAAEPVVLPAERAEPAPVTRRPARPVEEPVDDALEPPSEDVAELAPEVIDAPAPVREDSPARPAPPTAEELLAQANQARRDREYGPAVRLYRRLQRLYPRSREAALSHVTLGRLLLDGMGDAPGALSEFDRYLGQRRHRVLDEEARVGRALALMRLGRRADERAAWRALLEHHPDTLHAERARTRLAD